VKLKVACQIRSQILHPIPPLTQWNHIGRDLAKRKKSGKKKKKDSSSDDEDTIGGVNKSPKILKDSSDSDSNSNPDYGTATAKSIEVSKVGSSEPKWGISTRRMKRNQALTEDGSRYKKGSFIDIAIQKVEKEETYYEFGDGGEKEFEITTHPKIPNTEYGDEKEFGVENEFGTERESKKEQKLPEQTNRRKIIDDSSSSDEEVVVRQRQLNENDIDVPKVTVTAVANDSSESDSDSD